MKLIRFSPAGNEKPGAILADGSRIDISGFGSDYNEAFFGRQDLIELKRWLGENCASAPRLRP
jgi:hypothetical protein